MCGIAGLFHYGPSAGPVDLDHLGRINDQMASRGPDHAALWLDDRQRVGLAHRRLSIIDTSPAGNQPMHRGNLSITFNGEIYNYASLRRDLVALGEKFETGSDTEVILVLFKRYGVDMLSMLSGMFAFGIWDAASQELTLARDPYGIKPLYVADSGAALGFASTVAALECWDQVSSELSPAAITAFLMSGYVPEPWTIRRDVRMLEAGSWLIVNPEKGITRGNYSSVSGAISGALSEIPANISAQDCISEIRDGFMQSVSRHFVSDVPVGLFLSAGVDSGALAGMAAELGESGLTACTLGFEEYRGTRDDEVPLAAEIAQHYGLASYLCG